MSKTELREKIKRLKVERDSLRFWQIFKRDEIQDQLNWLSLNLLVMLEDKKEVQHFENESVVIHFKKESALYEQFDGKWSGDAVSNVKITEDLVFVKLYDGKASIFSMSDVSHVQFEGVED